MTRELRTGIFVAAAIFILAVFIFIVGDLTVLFRKSGYSLSVTFDSAAGLDKRAAVKMAGVPVGYVKDIRLSRRQAEVLMTIYPDVEIPKDSRATFSALGLLGEKYIEILPGESAANCRPGDFLPGLPSTSFDQVGGLFLSLSDQIKEAGQALREIMGPETKTSLNQALEGLASLSSELKDFIGKNQGDIRQTVRGAGRTFENLDKSVDEVSTAANDALKALKDIAAENRENVKLNLEKIKELIGEIEESLKLLNSSLEKINRGEGTLGRLIQEPELFEKAEGTLDEVHRTARSLAGLRAAAEFRADYYGKSDLVRPAFSLGVWFGPQKFLWAQAVRNPWERKFTATLQGGRRFGSIVPRVGVLESDFGVGIDYYTLRDKWVFSVESFDFNREPRPHFRLTSKFSLWKSVQILVGLDDFTLASNREFFFGLGWELR
jgi:phospholipid/cholesterol/gamma-HCH transport system substrate-binding protein